MTTPPTVPSVPAPDTSTAAKPHVLGIIALIAAAVGFVFACIPGALILGWILLPIAFILSIVALFLKGRKWPAITGLILAVVGTIVGFVVFFAILAGAASDAFGDDAAAPPSTPAATEAAADADADASDEAPDDAAEADFAVTIDGATQTKDYEDKPALVVSYDFTNNSDDATSFLVATSAKAFQNGVELEYGIVMDDSVDSANAMKEIKPGASITVQQAYVLDDTSDVTVEVTELFDFDDTMLATKVFQVK